MGVGGGGGGPGAQGVARRAARPLPPTHPPPLSRSAHLFAMVLHRPGHAPLADFGQREVVIKGGGLVRVFAVPQARHQAQGDGELGRGGARPHLAPQPLGHRGVVGRGVLERLPREARAQGRSSVGGRGASPRERLQQRPVVRGVDDDIDIAMILGGCPNHGGAPDVNVFHRDVVRRGRARGDGGPERVQVDGHDVDQADAGPGDGRHVGGVGADGQDAAVHGRVQRLHTAWGTRCGLHRGWVCRACLESLALQCLRHGRSLPPPPPPPTPKSHLWAHRRAFQGSR